MKIKLNIKSIITAEKLLNKPFGKFNLENEEEWLTLVYSTIISNNEETFTLETFKKTIGAKKVWKEIVSRVKNEFEYIGQFTSKTEKEPEQEANEADSLSFSEVASMMIVNGIEPNFVYELRTNEITDLLKAIEDKKKEQMESDRFWTFINILPHVDGKKLKSPEDLITFPWEVDAKKKKADIDFEEARKKFEKFIKSK